MNDKNASGTGFGPVRLAYEAELKRAKALALQEVEEEAAALGADAIIGLDLDYETIGQNGSMLMVSASGTAVSLA